MDSFSWGNFFIGLIGVASGFWMVKEAFHINHHILFVGWAENKWGPGSGTTFYRLLGLVICLFFMFVLLGYIDLVGMAFGTGAKKSSSSNSANIEATQQITTDNAHTRIAN